MENLALLGAIGTVCSVAFGYVGYQQGIKNACKDEGQESGELKADIKYIKSGIDDIKIDLKVQEKRVNELSERVTRVEESTRQAHKRIDEIKDS
jgi:peptidoglycan hydrolase CwlO-like protein